MAGLNQESILFTPIDIGALRVPNRFVRSATHEFMAEDDGTPTARHVDLYARLAEGEVGLIITGHAFVNPNGKASLKQTGIYDDRLVEALAKIPPPVHCFRSKIFVQIAHAGRQTKEKFCGCTPIAPSAVFEPTFKLTPKEMTGNEIRTMIDDFVRAGRRAKQAGFDGVQIHVAHGYLLSSFISPHTNRRSDDWGGTAANRARIVIEIVHGIKEVNGTSFPLIAKWNATDFLPAGLRIEESIEMAAMAEGAGLDGLEVSGGMSEAGKGSVWQGLRSEAEEGYFVESAARFKAALRIPVFGLGGNRTLAMMESYVRGGKVDLISLSRPLIREPFLVRKFRLGEVSKSECISCNKCFNPRGISCAQLKKS
jgi:2,4-dienoyl-CoA reductase-like NADH-dependent reductase (Old Yellow Enzyme family)